MSESVSRLIWMGEVVRRIFACFSVLIFLIIYGGPVGQAQESGVITKTAVLQALDKVTARITKLDVGVGRGIRFGSLLITVRGCDKRPPEEPPEATAFLEIIDDKPGEAPVKLFSGFMFASSPGLSAMEHPVYDVWVIDCRTDDPSTSAGVE
jgi:hypothetical protein